jgi:glycosyltransferase involved in cell wall biosynthesis
MRKILGKFSSELAKRNMQITYFTLISAPGVRLKDIIKYGDPDTTILHIHNWFNFLNYSTMKKILDRGYKIVFTLHDQRMFTGGCHYSLTCKGFETNCKSCPLLPFYLKRLPMGNLKHLFRLVIRFNNQITFLAPSLWMLQMAKNSKALQMADVYFIPNFHEKFLDKKSLDLNKNISNKKILTIGIASLDKKSFLKRGDILPQIEKKIGENKLEIKFIYLSDLGNPDFQFEEFWLKIDYLLVVSRADNSPNVIHEAKLLGIPVIATEVGGITELLNEGQDIFISDNDQVVEQILSSLKKISSFPSNIKANKIIRDYRDYTNRSLENLIEIYESAALK